MVSLRGYLRAVPVLVLLLPCLCRAESPAAANAPGSAYTSRPQAAGQNTAANAPVIKVRSDLVLVDVVVTKNGAPVKGLTSDKFRVLENGKEQELKVFEVHSQEQQPATASNAPAPKAPELAPNNYSDFSPYPPSSAVNVLLLDALNTQSKDQSYVRQQVLAYLTKIPPGTRMAVFSLSSSQLRLIQGFTADAGLLAKAVSYKDDIKMSTPEDAKSADEGPMEAQNLSELAGSHHAGQAAVANAAHIAENRTNIESYRTDDQERMTLAALGQIARYLSAIPGRKNLIWFSGSFPMFIDRVGVPISVATAPNPGAKRDYAEDVRETDGLLAAARIAVYPVDARGLLRPEGTANDASVDPFSVFGFTQDTSRMVFAQKKAVHGAELADQSLQQIAADTGGKAFVNTNGFQEAIQQALADGANYYTLGYMPQGKDDGGFRSIKVDVDGGYQLAYRDGYYADSAQTAASSSTSAMKEAFQFGAPPPSDILFKVRVIPASDPAAKGFTPAPGPAGASAKNLKRPLTRYLIDYMVDAHHFTFRKTPDGVAHTRLEFTVLAYDADGKVINFTEHAFGLDLTSEDYTKIMSGGLPQHQEIDLPVGQFSLRVVVRDLDSPRAGATEVPLTVAKK